jgi:hypothetical protein
MIIRGYLVACLVTGCTIMVGGGIAAAEGFSSGGSLIQSNTTHSVRDGVVDRVAQAQEDEGATQEPAQEPDGDDSGPTAPPEKPE